ncbi:hypothetical protein FACS189487_02890 [Campylobacterota bacterium]|nr:hypothetical protein FACS189487_02890 [Campylobacterota bacterium]
MPTNTNGAGTKKRTAEKSFAFVSYAHKDGRMVRSSIARAKEAGYSFWIDSGIEVSATWSDEIATAIMECAVFVVFISKAALKSGFVRKEIEFAIQKEKTIVPIYLNRIEILPPGLELWLNSTQGAIAENMSAKEISQQIIISLERNGVEGEFTKKIMPRVKRFAIAIAVAILLLCAAITMVFIYDPYKNKTAKNAVKNIEQTAQINTQINTKETAPKIENKVSAEDAQKPIENKQTDIEKIEKKATEKQTTKTAAKTTAKTTAKKADAKSAKAQIILQKKTFKTGEKAKISIKNSKNSRTIALRDRIPPQPLSRSAYPIHACAHGRHLSAHAGRGAARSSIASRLLLRSAADCACGV